MSLSRRWVICALVPVLTGLALMVTDALAARGLALAPGDAAPELRANRSDESFVKPDYSAHRLTVINF